jgi:hypothetical protein
MKKSFRSPGTKSASMPGQFYAYLFYGFVMATPIVPVVLFREYRGAQEVWQLSALTRADTHDPRGSVHRGILRGPTGRTTALGKPAALWYGDVVQTVRAGKSSVANHRCFLGGSDQVTLQIGAHACELPLPHPSDVTADGPGSWLLLARFDRPHLLFDRETSVSPLPPEVLDRCTLSGPMLDVGTWSYREVVAPEGVAAAYFGCRGIDTVHPCDDAETAAGHLITKAPAAALVSAAARGALGGCAFLILLLIFFDIVAGIGAVLALRAAARARR